MAEAIRDQNHVTVALGQDNSNSTNTLPFLIDSITGRLLVDSSGGGGGVNVETPIGLVNGSNTSYTVSNAPKFIVIDGSTYFASTPASQPAYTYLAGTITVNPLIAPTEYIKSIY